MASVEKLLPESVAKELRQAAESAGEITSKLAAELDERLEIERRYGVTKLRLQNFLRRERRKEATEKDGDKKDSGNATPAPTVSKSADTSAPHESQPYEDRIVDHRRRQASVSAILSETFGRFAKSHPDLWDRRAYLMLVGLVYERLATNEEELSTEELVTLSKVLAENRRAEAQSSKKTVADENSPEHAGPSDALPEHFADTVRQVYGTNFQMPDSRRSCAESKCENGGAGG